MSTLFEIYNLIFYQPISKLLIFFYQNFKDLGLAVIFLTILVRVILSPFHYKSSKEQEKLLKIKKGIEEIEKKFNGERKEKEILELYKKEKINPFFNLLSLFIQLPILIALYQVFLKATIQFNPLFLGVFNLSKPSLILVLIATFLQILYLKIASPRARKEKNKFSIFSNLNLSFPFTHYLFNFNKIAFSHFSLFYDNLFIFNLPKNFIPCLKN
jgi:YidC/Oxa1 family membrane protein insertase